MYELLQGMRVVECASFVAGPSSGLHLLQLGAEVIRLDPIAGGADRFRWPIAPNGKSLYWEGLNKGKKSIAIDLSKPEGRELAIAIITAPDENGGLFVTNYAPKGFFAHARLAERRPDLISVWVMGWDNGAPAMDYTVNAACGLPLMTGSSRRDDEPTNHVLPAWDLLTGSYAAFALLAAERQRRATGQGQEIQLPLSSVAAGALANLGQVAEVVVDGDRPRIGNELFGAFGRDFLTADGVRLMVVAITPRQWSKLVESLDLHQAVAAIEAELGLSFETDEGRRYQHRHRLYPLVEAEIRRRTCEELAPAFDRGGVCWSRYRTLKQAVAEEAMFAIGAGHFESVAHPSGRRYPTPGAPGRFLARERRLPPRAPVLGQHTDEILSRVLKLNQIQIGRLHDKGLVAACAK